MKRRGLLAGAASFAAFAARAQTPPSAAELDRAGGLHAAAARGDAAAIDRLIAGGADPDSRDAHRRTPLHVAAHFGRLGAARALVRGGADPRALDARRYDIVTIAAVANDLSTLKASLAAGCSARNITSRTTARHSSRQRTWATSMSCAR